MINVCGSSRPIPLYPHLTAPQSSRLRRTRCTTVQTAKRGIEIACRPPVCLSVALVDKDHIDWKSWKLTALTISSISSLFGAQRPSTYTQENMGKFLGWEKEACWSTKAAMSVKCIKIYEKLLWRAYRNSPTFFRTTTRHTASHSPRLGVRNPTQNFNRYYLRNG